ncbi:MAG TPA: hypothetical protein VFS32_10450 [Candidatus Limnocylindrales bacterium]|nr:hypothetical protein [Candidatus Limnocylindrales bacterium]
MCGSTVGTAAADLVEAGPAGGVRSIVDLADLLPIARGVVSQEEVRRTAAGFIGYGATKPGDRVLIGVDSQTDPAITAAIATALRELGASVDVVVAQVEPDREFGPLDELAVAMRRQPWTENPRRWEGLPWVEELARSRGYDLLIHGKGGAIPKVSHRYEGFPWVVRDHFDAASNLYPRPLHRRINERTWSRITDHPGSRLRLTDPEGTNLSLTILDAPFHDTGRHDYGLSPKWGHLMAHPPTPIEPTDDTSGVIAGTLSHFNRPFPRIEVELENARMVDVRGGGEYGAAWRELENESKETQYPCFPGPGLFWIWEIAIGTNPKIVRPSNIECLSSGGFEWERRRAGIIHCGIGTRWRSSEEVWAGERHLLYGHLHVHLMAATMVVETPEGDVPVIENGRLSAYDDPDVRDLAAQFGDPDELLRDDWVPQIPGITVPGSYEEYATDPARWVYGVL